MLCMAVPGGFWKELPAVSDGSQGRNLLRDLLPNPALPELLLPTAFGESALLLLLGMKMGPAEHPGSLSAAACPCWSWDRRE